MVQMKYISMHIVCACGNRIDEKTGYTICSPQGKPIDWLCQSCGDAESPPLMFPLFDYAVKAISNDRYGVKDHGLDFLTWNVGSYIFGNK